MSRGLFGYVSGGDTVTAYAYADTVISTTVYSTAGTHTFTVPTGVDYVIANIIGGGGGTQQGATAGGQGGTSSVAFTAGTITALGGLPIGTTDTSSTNVVINESGNRFGAGARLTKTGSAAVRVQGGDGAFIRCGGVVTPGQSLTVVVGAGGTAGTNGAAGRSGIVWLEYGAGSKRRCELFKTTGTFTPPSGVTSATAYIFGGGGGAGHGDGGGSDGSNSSVAFASGTASGLGGQGDAFGRPSPTFIARRGQADNTADGAYTQWATTTAQAWAHGERGQMLVASAAVTAGVGITVTIGAGGSSDSGTTGAGSGVVWIEYFVP
jgi:hypothetical protein